MVLNTQNSKTLNLYTCGPTVYNLAHIGNLRSYVFADLVYRAQSASWRTPKQNVKWIMNITDVDDKTIKNTIDQFGENAGVEELKKYTDKYTKIFLQDLEKLNISVPEINFVKVSDKIIEIQDFIAKLIDKGYAYKAEDGSTYFSIEKYQQDFGHYGGLVGEKFLEGKKINARIKNDEYDKENLSDFALWKAYDPKTDGQIFWDDPESAKIKLGKGRPGWHIECSVINYVAFGGETTDIHTGGVDLIFPHHTNEIAQSEAYFGKEAVQAGKKFVADNGWLHSEHMLIDGKKMSKSLGNIYTLEDLEKKGFDPLAYRYLLLQTNYKQKVNFTWESLEAARTSYQNLIKKLAMSTEHDSFNSAPVWIKKFYDAANDNLNTSKALSIINELINIEKISLELLATVFMFDEILGLNLRVKVNEILSMPENIKEKTREREKFRQKKDWVTADRLRKEIDDLGFEIMDTGGGSFVYKKIL